MKVDRTVKILLGLIALFLAILALNPLVKPATNAWAQVPTPAGTAGNDGLISIGSRVVDVSTIQTDAGKTVRAVYPMDNTQCFIVQYDGYFRVYRILDVRVAPGTIIGPTPPPSPLRLN